MLTHSGAYLADTNVYVTASNDGAARRQFEAFLERHGPLIVSSVVVAEVVLGIANAPSREAAVRAMGAGTVVVAPWVRSVAFR